MDLDDTRPTTATDAARDTEQPDVPDHDDTKPDVAAVDGGWSTQVTALLEDWRNRMYAAQSAHYASADRFRLLNYIFGVPAIIFSSVVGTAIFAGLQNEKPQSYVVAGISILAAVLAGLQTFLRFPERAAQHASAADWYSAIRRDIEEQLHLPVETRGAAKECLDKLRKEINRVTQDSPELDVQTWQSKARRFGVLEPRDRP